MKKTKKKTEISESQKKALGRIRQAGTLMLTFDLKDGATYHLPDGHSVRAPTAEILISKGLLIPAGDGLLGCESQSYRVVG